MQKLLVDFRVRLQVGLSLFVGGSDESEEKEGDVKLLSSDRGVDLLVHDLFGLLLPVAL